MDSIHHHKCSLEKNLHILAAIQRRSCASQHLRQRNTSDQIEQVSMKFEEATILRKLIKLKTKLINRYFLLTFIQV